MRRLTALAALTALLFAASSAHASFLDKLKGAVDQVTSGSGSGTGSGTTMGTLGTDQIIACLKEALRVVRKG